MQRFSRTELLLGEQAFSRLANSHVAVIGVGAVGGYAIEGLARAGLGQLTLVDFDSIQPTNINRQILATERTIGKPKVDAARERIISINPHCQTQPLELFADDQSITRVLEMKPDLVIDAIDSVNPKTQVLQTTYQSGVTVISSMGAALRTDPEKIKIGDISQTSNCPLAKIIRKRLRSRGIQSGITCVYSTEQVQFDFTQSNLDDSQDPQYPRGRKRNTLGSLPTLTGIFGLILANLAIKTLTEK
ncbi:MAG: tRNA threonylcarbamoyladenosine dehydratase [Desulfobulbaceae bacterium]|nr:MAG: tRNA threonylcarbamoyladenosine dehydratase [Desulfobulbaceae bacterium]